MESEPQWTGSACTQRDFSLRAFIGAVSHTDSSESRHLRAWPCLNFGKFRYLSSVCSSVQALQLQGSSRSEEGTVRNYVRGKRVDFGSDGVRQH